MKILLLEDNQERINKFKELFKNQTIFCCSDIHQAIDTCNNWNIDIMFLDHDLDNRIWVDSREENTGYQFVKWLVDNKIQEKCLIYIHSMNPIGANRMLNYLLNNGRDGIWIPFPFLKLEEIC
jgi:CheY-like chemotaxis protein